MSAEIQLGWNNGKLQAGAAGAAAIVNRASAQMTGALSSVSSAKLPAWLIGGGLTAATGIAVGAIKGLADEYDHIWDLSQRLNESPESIQRIGLMAKLSGSDVDVAVKALQKLNLEIRKGPDSEGGKALKALGLDIAEFIKLSPEVQLSTLAAAFQQAQASGKGFVEINTLIGKKFTELIPLLKSSREELEAISKVEVVSDSTIANIARMNDAWDTFIAETKASSVNFVSEAVRGWSLVFGAMSGSKADSFTERMRKVNDEQNKIAADAQKVAAALKKAQGEADAMAAKLDAAAKAGDSYADEQDRVNKELYEMEDAANKAAVSMEKLNAERQNAERGKIQVQLIPLEKQGFAEAELDVINKQIAAISGKVGAEEEMVRLQTQRALKETEILQIKAEVAAEDQRIIDAEAEKKRAADEVASKYKTNLDMLDLELAILNAQASGRDKKARQLEHERDVQEETARIVEATGLAYDEAAKKAEELVSAKEKVDGKRDGKEGGRSKIHGYSQDQGTADDARKRAETRVNDASANAQKARDEKSGYGGFSESRLTPRGGDIGVKTPATDKEKGGDPAIQAGAIVTQILPQILSILSGQ